MFLPTNRNPKIILVSWNKIALQTSSPKIVVMGGSAEAAHSFSAASLFLPHRQRYKATIHRGAQDDCVTMDLVN